MRRFLLALLFSLALPNYSYAALPTPIQVASGSGAASTTESATLGAGVGGGHLTIAVIFAGSLSITPTTISSVSDDKGDSFTLLDQQAAGSGATSAAGVLAYCLNTTTGATVITATLSQAATISRIQVGEYPVSGATLDKHTAAVGTTTSAASGSTSATSQASELLIGWVSARTTGTMALSNPNPANDLSQSLGTSQVAAFSDALLNTTGTQSSSYTIGGTSQFAWANGVATFTVPSSHLLSSLGAGS